MSSSSEVVVNSESGIQKWARSFGSLGGFLVGLNKEKGVSVSLTKRWAVGGMRLGCRGRRRS